MHPTSFDEWCGFIGEVMSTRAESIRTILDASDVRERWIQGEIYLAANAIGVRGFSVSKSVENYPDADLSHVPAGLVEMLGELKVLGRDYESKVFSGTANPPFTEELSHSGQLLLTPEHPELMRNNLGYLLYDYKKLISYNGTALRILILLLDRRRRQTTLGRLLEAVEFEAPGRIIVDQGDWNCKAWHVQGRLPQQPN